MANNANLSKVVRVAIELGKNLGDAYIWFFFRNNRAELDMHMQHEATRLYVGGIGGLGELDFIKKTYYIDGLYVLYHSITSILRIGDFSLYDVNDGIVPKEQLLFALYNYRKLDMSVQSDRQKLINSFVNSIFLYDDHFIITFNYKNTSKKVSLKEINSSSLTSSTPPNIK